MISQKSNCYIVCQDYRENAKKKHKLSYAPIADVVVVGCLVVESGGGVVVESGGGVVVESGGGVVVESGGGVVTVVDRSVVTKTKS